MTAKNGTRSKAETENIDVSEVPAVLILKTGKVQMLNGIDPDSLPTLLRRAANVIERELGAHA